MSMLFSRAKLNSSSIFESSGVPLFVKRWINSPRCCFTRGRGDEQYFEFQCKNVSIKDGRHVTINCIVKYSLLDVSSEVFEYDSVITEKLTESTLSAAEELTYEDLLEFKRDVGQIILSESSNELKEYEIILKSFSISLVDHVSTKIKSSNEAPKEQDVDAAPNDKKIIKTSGEQKSKGKSKKVDKIKAAVKNLLISKDGLPSGDGETTNEMKSQTADMHKSPAVVTVKPKKQRKYTLNDDKKTEHTNEVKTKPSVDEKDAPNNKPPNAEPTRQKSTKIVIKRPKKVRKYASDTTEEKDIPTKENTDRKSPTATTTPTQEQKENRKPTLKELASNPDVSLPVEEEIVLKNDKQDERLNEQVKNETPIETPAIEDPKDGSDSEYDIISEEELSTLDDDSVNKLRVLQDE
ncbi:uncharacterized protein LOC130628761 [Hydractinia symbiolongicarpus]|uniref:uncharacterized protein LOC130628761 n=1 Tax=Hydractinia symbiolongicarpus TaxID=13093 RepID=UPI00254D2FEB|nr:uncharacterized protein LOC130628761 [Hydractinia symbiolongicarpus]